MTPDLHRRRLLLRVASAPAACLGLPTWAQSGAGRPSYVLSVVPQFPAAELHRDWAPPLERVAHEAGLNLSLKLATSIPRFEAELMAGFPDFAFMNPYHAVMAMKAQGYLPLVRDSKPLTGILVVRRDSAVKSVKDLSGHEIAFPAPNAFGASLWMRALLSEREGITYTPNYVQTHSNVYRQVIRGKAMAGGGVNNTLLQETDEVRADLRVLLETPGAAPHPLAAHPRVPAPVQMAFAQAWMRLAADPAGQVFLKDVAMSRPMRADYARDFKPLEQFKLDKYVVAAPPVPL